jgi:hypothetical protein
MVISFRVTNVRKRRTCHGDNLIFGKWDELALLMWSDSVDVLFNKYTLAGANQIQVVITMLCNAVVLRPRFCVSIDAASQ